MAIERAEDIGGDVGKESRGDTYFLPTAALEGMEVKPGDVVKFRVVGQDDEGNIEVEYYHADANKGSGWEDDMRKTMSGPMNSEPEEY